MKTVVTDAAQLYEHDRRLDASYHASDGLKALRFIRQWAEHSEQSPEPTGNILRESRAAYITRRVDRLQDVCVPDGIFILGRFKRIFVDDPEHGVPYLTGGSIMQADPLMGAKFLSYRFTKNMDRLVLHKRMILVTCSGTIGNTVYVNANIEGAVGSPDLLRIVADPAKIPPGYLYAFLSSPLGKALIEQKTYGAVVPHIEAHHVTDLPIPRLGAVTEQRIHELIERAAALRVEAQVRIHHLVQQLNEEILGIPKRYCARWPHEWSYDVWVVYRNNNLRLDPFHYAGHAVEYRPYLKAGPRLSDMATIQLPGQFKRMYTGPQGVPYLSGVDIYQFRIVPRLWLSHRQPELPELVVSKGQFSSRQMGSGMDCLGDRLMWTNQ